MDKTKLVNQLRATAAAIKPLTESTSSNAAVWDGEQYVKTVAKQPDPYALSWWSTLNSVAALLEAQDGPLNGSQVGYLTQTLFGGMGSLNDLYFDSRTSGPLADSVNRELDHKRHALHELFQDG